MRRATAVVPRDQMQARACVARVRLDHDHRHRRRLVLTTSEGESVLLDLPSAAHLRGGEGLLLDDGDIVAIEAVPEKLLEITAPDQAALLRIAWHLGNRHLPTDLAGHVLRIREDHVLEEMVRGLGGTFAHIEAPFDPEGGAYATAAHHDHDHDHDHARRDHVHSHDHPHRHDDG
ncbi:MAG: urease accessory protein UreE [Methylovirgula sp.]